MDGAGLLHGKWVENMFTRLQGNKQRDRQQEAGRRMKMIA